MSTLTTPIPSTPPTGGWTRAHIVFLSISTVLVFALLFWAKEILLPFVLALVIAYVLTPLVAYLERFKVPRAVAILSVYAIVLGGLYGSIASLAPRLYKETAGLLHEAPRILRQATSVVGPRFDAIAQRITPAPPTAEQAPETPAVEVTPRADGSFGIEVKQGLDLVQDDASRFHLEPRSNAGNRPIRFSRLLDESGARFGDYAKKHTVELLQMGRAVIAQTIRGVFLLFMTLMVAGYLMFTRETVIGFFRSLFPARHRPSFDRLMVRIDRGLSGVVRGQLLICLVNGVISAFGFWLFGLKYWPLIALVAAFGSLIPIFGSILSAVPAVAIGLTQDFWTALWVLLWIIGIHQVEANLLNPKIIGTAARIHPCIVVFVLITGEHFFGLWGALLAVPSWSIAQSLFNHFRYQALPDATDTLLPIAPTRPSSATVSADKP